MTASPFPTSALASPVFAEFWLDYLRAHARVETRALHYAGAILGFAFWVMLVSTFNPAFLIPMCIAPYAAAWTGHQLFEGNKPKTFSRPLWSLRGGLWMVAMGLTGYLGPELSKAGVARRN